jgi:hypothetical protein
MLLSLVIKGFKNQRRLLSTKMTFKSVMQLYISGYIFVLVIYSLVTFLKNLLLTPLQKFPKSFYLHILVP